MNADIENTPAGSKAATQNERTRVRIAIYLASRANKPQLLNTLRERGRSAGMNGAEMSANEQGTSHDAIATVCLQFVKSIVDRPGDATPHALQAMHDVGYTLNDISEVMAQVNATT